MWSAIRWLVLRIAAIRWLFKLGWLGALLPIALLLKTIGLPLLAILGVVGLPILALLFLFGLPIFLVLLFGGMLMGLLGFALMIGVAALKFAIFVVLPIWLIAKLVAAIYHWMRRRGDNGGGTPDVSTGTPPDPFTKSPSDDTSPPHGDPLGGVDPA